MKSKKNIVPPGWEKTKIGEVFSFTGGGTPSKRNPEFWNGKINWASVKDIKGQFLFKTEDSITEEGLKKSSSNLANPNQVLLVTRIAPGKCIITQTKVAINQDLKIVNTNSSISPKFIFYLFGTLERDIIKRSSGTTVLGIKLSELLKIPFLLPPLPEQRRIVDKIEELFTQLDKGVEQLKAVQQQLRTYRQAVLKAAFEGKLTEDWRSAFASDLHSHFGEGGKASADGEKTKVEGSHAGGVPPIGGQGVRAAQAQSAQELLEQIKIERQQHYEQELEQWTAEVEEWEANGKPGKKPRKPRKPKEYPPLTEEELKALPELPEGWEISRLGNFADIIGGVTKGRKLEGKKTIELPYLRVANVQDGYLDLKVIKTIQVLPDDLEKYRLLEGDVLYTEGGDKDKLGRGTIWKNEIDNCIHQNHVFRARLFKELTLPSFIAYYSQTQ
jgi:type I restriction enzyme S subunit